MAKTNTTNNKSSFLTSPIFIGIIALCVIILISVVIIWLSGSKEPETVETTRQPESVNQVESQTSQNSSTIKPEVVQYEGESPNELDNLTGSFSVRPTKRGNILVTAVTIDQYLEEGGTCTLNLLNKGAVSATSTHAIETEVGTSTCGELQLSLDGVKSGTYDVEVVFESAGKKGSIKMEGVEI